MSPQPPREPAGADELIIDWLKRLEATTVGGFRDLALSVEKLRDESVHRRDFDRYRDEQTLVLAQAQLRHDRDVTELKDRAKEDIAQVRDDIAEARTQTQGEITDMKAAAQAAKGDRLARIGLGLTALLTLVGWVVTSYLHYH